MIYIVHEIINIFCSSLLLDGHLICRLSLFCNDARGMHIYSPESVLDRDVEDLDQTM